MIRDLLQGKPFGHPLHPMIVHLPIGLWLLSLLLDLGSFIIRDPWIVQGAFYSMLIGLICAAMAAIPGFIDWLSMRADHPAQTVALYHMALNMAATGLYAINTGLRANALDHAVTPIAPLVLSIIGYAAVLVSGYLGGVMIYDDGISVGRHRHEGEMPRETLYQARVGTTEEALPGAHERPGEFIPIADDDTLADNCTLRVQLNGYVICVTRSNGLLYAFQEFCTHRFGPLSEGRICDGHVTCPWHGSTFDCRTGQVLHGPAKVDLKTFPTQVRDGRICVQVPAALPIPEKSAETLREPSSTAQRRPNPQETTHPGDHNRARPAANIPNRPEPPRPEQRP